MKKMKFAAMVFAACAVAYADDPVARIGETTYETFTEVITAANETAGGGAVIEILRDFEESFAKAEMTGVPITNSCAIVGAPELEQKPVMTVTNPEGYGFYIDGAFEAGRERISVAFSNLVVTAGTRTTTEGNDHFMMLRQADVTFGDGFCLSNVLQSTYGIVSVDAGGQLYLEDGCEVTDLTSRFGVIRIFYRLDSNLTSLYKSQCFMNGGVIRNCTSMEGEGVAVDVVGTASYFEMNGGTITNCALAETATASMSDDSAVVWIQLNAYHTNQCTYAVSLNGGCIVGNGHTAVSGVHKEGSYAAVALSGSAEITGNYGADIWVRNDRMPLYLTGQYTGETTLRSPTENVVGMVAGMCKANSSACGYSRIHPCEDGKEDYVLVRNADNYLVWVDTPPVRVGSTRYRLFSDAIESIGSDGSGTVTLCADGVDIDRLVAITNSSIRIEGEDSSRTLVWPLNCNAFNFNSCDVVFSNVMITAAQSLTTNGITGARLRMVGLLNINEGNLVFDSGAGVSNVTTAAGGFGVLCLGTDGLLVDSDNKDCSLTLGEGSLMYGLTSPYGPLRFNSRRSVVNVNGGTIKNCASTVGEAAVAYFLDGGTFNMTAGAITDCSSATTNSAVIWNNAAYRQLLCNISGGEISANDAGSIMEARYDSSHNAHVILNLDGTAVLSDCERGICAEGGQMTVNVESNWTGIADLYLRDTVLTEDEPLILGEGSAASVGQFDWINSDSYTGYALQSIDGLLTFAPGESTSEIFGDAVAYSATAGLQSTFTNAVNGASSGETVYLLKDVALDTNITLGYKSVLTIDGRGHIVDMQKTSAFYSSSYSTSALTLKNMVLTNNCGKIVTSGDITLGRNFVFTDFMFTAPKDCHSFYIGGIMTIEDGAVIENGLSQVGIIGTSSRSSRIIMNGGVIRNISFDANVSKWGTEGVVLNIRGGTFEMNGGVISNCVWDATASTPDFKSVLFAHKNNTGSRIILKGGSITGNTAGIYADGLNAESAGAESYVEVSGSCYVYGNTNGDMLPSEYIEIVQTGDFTGKFGVYTGSRPADGDQFGTWESGSGTENFVCGRHYGTVVDGKLVWTHDKTGFMMIVY